MFFMLRIFFREGTFTEIFFMASKIFKKEYNIFTGMFSFATETFQKAYTIFTDMFSHAIRNIPEEAQYVY